MSEQTNLVSIQRSVQSGDLFESPTIDYQSELRRNVDGAIKYISKEIFAITSSFNTMIFDYIKPIYIPQFKKKRNLVEGIANSSISVLDRLLSELDISSSYFEIINHDNGKENQRIFYEKMGYVINNIIDGNNHSFEVDSVGRIKIVCNKDNETKKYEAFVINTELDYLYDIKDNFAELKIKLNDATEYEALYNQLKIKLKENNQAQSKLTVEYNAVKKALEEINLTNQNLEGILKTRPEIKRLFDASIEIEGVKYVSDMGVKDKDYGSISAMVKKGVINLDYKVIYEAYKATIERTLDERVLSRTKMLSKKVDELSKIILTEKEEKAKSADKQYKSLNSLVLLSIYNNLLYKDYKYLSEVSAEKSTMLEKISDIVKLLVDENATYIEMAEEAKSVQETTKKQLLKNEEEIENLERIIQEKMMQLKSVQYENAGLNEELCHEKNGRDAANQKIGDTEVKLSTLELDFKKYKEKAEHALQEALRLQTNYRNLEDEKDRYKIAAENAQAELEILRLSNQRDADLDDITQRQIKISSHALDGIHKALAERKRFVA
jgi:hypothetical protein